MAPVLLLDERIKSNGGHSRTWATCTDHCVRVTDDDGTSGELSFAVVDQVMRRYGRPLDHEIVLEGASLTCGTYKLRRLRHRAAVDVEGRDYLVWERPGDEPLVCVAATVTAALRFLIERRSKLSPSGI